MSKLNKYSYRLKTISRLVLSPREHQGYYMAAGDFGEEIYKRNNIEQGVKIIYPFYQYGTYDGYHPEQTHYYIPGSSIKGAMLSYLNKQYSNKLLVDDVLVDYSHLGLHQLQKLQHASEETNKHATIKKFFPNIAVEMIQADVEFLGQLYAETDPSHFLNEAQMASLEKLKQLHKGIVQVCSGDTDMNDDTRTKLEETVSHLETWIHTSGDKDSRTYLLLLGGYKGLILSGIFDKDAANSAVYLDTDKLLPHGLVQVRLEE